MAELWIDPAWYEAQDSPDPLPSPGLPDHASRCGEPSVLVGRTSRSRNIHPDIDCGSDSGVSRRQAQLTTDGSRWFVEDLESANGTFIGQASGALPEDPIPVGVKRELDPDDRIYLGAWTRLVIREATEDEIASLGLGAVWHGGCRKQQHAFASDREFRGHQGRRQAGQPRDRGGVRPDRR